MVDFEKHLICWILMGIFTALYIGGCMFYIRQLFISPRLADVTLDIVQNGDHQGNHTDGDRVFRWLSTVILNYVVVIVCFIAILDDLKPAYLALMTPICGLIGYLLGIKKPDEVKH